MIAPKNILTTWKKFDDFPMETLTKAWFHKKSKNKKQRDVSLEGASEAVWHYW